MPTNTLTKELAVTLLGGAVVTATAGAANGTLKDWKASLPQSVMLVTTCIGVNTTGTLAGVLQGSNDAGTTWTTCATVVAQGTAAGVVRANVATPYRAYRFNPTIGGSFSSDNFCWSAFLVGADVTYTPVTQV